ncbi:MAG: 6-carboxytetrahydropterin synthase [Bacteroidetes bacterium]|nr:6-carboxytetrahydropterin synthase [Bacteroidota bacterium]MCL5025679.1 6-carboxytetrahydropterin synthase [Chloroflexota bacterium]
MDRIEDTYYCANCLEPIRWEPVMQDGLAYCCRGCAGGGPCVCSYAVSSISSSEEPDERQAESRAPASRAEDARDALPALTPPGDVPAAERAPGQGGLRPEYEETLRSALKDMLSVCLRLLKTIEETKPAVQPSAELPALEEQAAPEQPQGEAAAAPAAPASPPVASAISHQEAEGELALLEEALERFCLLVSPVQRLDIAQELASELGELPLVCAAVLLNFVPDDAAYQVETTDEPKLVQFLLSWPRLRPRHTRISPASVELTLPGPLQSPAKPEVATAEAQPAPVEQAGAPVAAPSPAPPAEGTALNLDVFFDARHSVALDGQPGPLHSHFWRVQATIADHLGATGGRMMPVAEAKRLLQDAVQPYRDATLNDIPPFDQQEPVPSRIAAVLYEELSAAMAPLPLRLVSVSVWESPATCAQYPAPRTGDAGT